MSIDQQTIDRASATDLVALMLSRGIELKKQGAEFVGLCPFHEETTPSFSVNQNKGLYHCFGCGAGGDAIAFLREHAGFGFEGAVRELARVSEGSDVAAAVRSSAPARLIDEWEIVAPVPSDAPTPPVGLGGVSVSARWRYLDAAGRLLFYVCRFERPGGKDIRPLSYWRNGETGELGWRWKSMAAPRPLFGLDLLAAHPKAQVLIVEGEKSADAAARLIAAKSTSGVKAVAVTWPGGANSLSSVDLAPLRGRKIVIWPDADEPGAKAADELCRRLGPIAAQIKRLDPPAGVVAGWDAADAEADSEFDFGAFAKTVRLVGPELAQTGPAPAVEVPAKQFEAPGAVSAAVHEAALDGDRRRLQQAENQQLQNLNAGHTVPADMSLDEMVKNCVWLADGEAVAYIGGPCTMFLTFKEFCSLTARSKTEVDAKGDGTKSPRKEVVANALLWKCSQERAHVMTRTFHAGAETLCADPEGRAAINTWRPTMRREARANIQPFLDHVDYLFGEEEAGVFLDWVAHIEQRPGELPHYGWLHVAQQHGCGRNWLASVLARVFRGYVAPNLDLGALLDSNFNGELGGRVLAVVDEVRAGGGENSHAYENKLRNMVNPEFRQMNPKFGRQYKEHNACRWLVFSNHLNALPLNDEDRRWRAVVHKAPPRAPAVYEQLYALLADAEFINAVAVFLATRDISKFKPGEKPPMTASKREVVASSKSMDQHSIEQICKHWPAEVITHEDIATYVTSGESTVFTHAMRRSLEDARAKQFERQIKIDNHPKKMWAIRNADHWMAIKNNDAVRREAQKARADGSMLTASAIMAVATSSEEEAVL